MLKANIICERDGWTWRIEPQEDCNSGVDIVYCQDGKPEERTTIGDLEDAAALASAINAYVAFAVNKDKSTPIVYPPLKVKRA